MIYTLAWKELREHQGIWLTMVVMTVVLGAGLAKIVALGDPHIAVPTAAFTIFGMAAAYGVVCGSMMFAGEREGGTLPFLDIFLGRRGLLWAGKAAIGTMLVLTQSLAVAAIFVAARQELPGWALGLVGYAANARANLDASVWLLILPVVALEAYAWGLLGSSLTKRVLAGAAVAAVGFTPVWLFAIVAPSPCFLTLRVVLAVGLLVISAAIFRNRQDEPALAPSDPKRPADVKEQFLERWDRFEAGGAGAKTLPQGDAVPSYPSVATADAAYDEPVPFVPAPGKREPELLQAESPGEVLWWLTLQQARSLCWILAGVGLVAGLLVHANGQALWPLATLLLGVACGTSAFAPEQRDLSYQFLSSQHFPLKTIWRFKILFWLAVAIIESAVIIFGSFLVRGVILLQRLGQPGPRVELPFWFAGTFSDLMGPMLFFGVWVIYGFCAGQLFVMLCRKNILGLLVSALVATAALGLWLPSLLCGGMNGWQLWVAPLSALLASWFLMRAWAGGRIMERKPLAALVGFGAAPLLWALLNFGYRAWECPDVGPPLDQDAYRASLPADKDNAAAKAIHQAIARFDGAKLAQALPAQAFAPDESWPALLAGASRLPAGVLEIPRADGQLPVLKHLPACQQMADELIREARAKERAPAFEHLAQVLALSRNLRNKAPVQSYLAGVQMEEDALRGLDDWLDRGKPDPRLLRRVLDELHRHARETPPALDCVRTECYHSGGLLPNPNAWNLPGARNQAGERWLAGSIALSFETPWEEERKTRIWQLVWAGLFRAVETPHWELPEPGEMPPAKKKATRPILERWLPAPGARLTRADMFHLLDTSWLADDRLFCAVGPLRDAATRARWRVDATRLTLALSLYRLEEGKSAPALQDLVPKYVPDGLPIDPYSGQAYSYRTANGVETVWSTGPDRVDHGGRNHGGDLRDDDAGWARGDFDLIMRAPRWP